MSSAALVAAISRTARALPLLASAFRSLGSYPVGGDVKDFALRRDGRRFAWRIGDRHLEIRDISGGTLPLLVTPRGRSTPRLDVALGDGFLTVQAGKHAHLVRWERGLLRFTRAGRAGLRSSTGLRRGRGRARIVPPAGPTRLVRRPAVRRHRDRPTGLMVLVDRSAMSRC